MSKNKSCLGCRWLFTRDTGYSSYTVEGCDAYCVHGRNKFLPAAVPDELRTTTRKTEDGQYTYEWVFPDLWGATKEERCELFEEGTLHSIDVDGEDIVTLEEGQRILLEKGDPMPLLIARYFSD